MIRRFVLLVCAFLIVHVVSGQSFKLMRYDEDYAYLKDSIRNTYESFKYIPLTKSRKRYPYLSVGGEVRAEYDYVRHEDWGEVNLGADPYFTERLTLHADWLLSKRFRIFTQLRSAHEQGRNNGPRPIDEDQLNVQNLFIDVVPIQISDKSLRLRIGRQEINYGSGRLISVQEGPNARLYFDGTKMIYASPNFSLDAFVLAAAKVKPGVFDNKSSKKPNLWGAYGVWKLPKSDNLDVYYLGFKGDQLTYEVGIANEVRHSIGFRFWRLGTGFIYNLEAVYQFGKFGESDIQAWTGSIDVGYSFENLKGNPVIGIKNDYISGDSSTEDKKLQTFNPIYPKAGYFGFNPQLGPVNLIDIHPYLTWNASNRVMLTFDVVFNWRYALNDGVYRPNGRFSTGSMQSNKRYIGTVFLTGMEWSISRFLSFSSGVQYFKTGAFIDDIIPSHKDGFFMSYQCLFKF